MSTRTWDVDVAGRMFAVSALQNETGKWIVRVDGRVVAKPLGNDESERLIRVGGALYRFHRDDKGEPILDLHERPIPPGASKHPAALLPDRIEEMPLGFSPSDALRSSKIVWVVVIGIFAAMLWYAMGPSYEKQAAGRVRDIVADMALGTGPEVQFAVGLWARNVRTLSDRDELSWASDNFDKWRRQKDLYHKFSSWEIVDSELVKDARHPTAIVTVDIEGTRYRMVVPERLPISWAD